MERTTVCAALLLMICAVGTVTAQGTEPGATETLRHLYISASGKGGAPGAGRSGGWSAVQAVLSAWPRPGRARKYEPTTRAPASTWAPRLSTVGKTANHSPIQSGITRCR